jgi:hypothetical protein
MTKPLGWAVSLGRVMGDREWYLDLILEKHRSGAAEGPHRTPG